MKYENLGEINDDEMSSYRAQYQADLFFTPQPLF